MVEVIQGSREDFESRGALARRAWWKRREAARARRSRSRAGRPGAPATGAFAAAFEQAAKGTETLAETMEKLNAQLNQLPAMFVGADRAIRGADRSAEMFVWRDEKTGEVVESPSPRSEPTRPVRRWETVMDQRFLDPGPQEVTSGYFPASEPPPERREGLDAELERTWKEIQDGLPENRPLTPTADDPGAEVWAEAGGEVQIGDLVSLDDQGRIVSALSREAHQGKVIGVAKSNSWEGGRVRVNRSPRRGAP